MVCCILVGKPDAVGQLGTRALCSAASGSQAAPGMTSRLDIPPKLIVSLQPLPQSIISLYSNYWERFMPINKGILADNEVVSLQTNEDFSVNDKAFF